MPKPNAEKPGRPHLERDSQQWVYDYVVQESGRWAHWWSDGDREFPKSVRTSAMVNKHIGRQAQRAEALAKAELAAGHSRTALQIYYLAALQFMRAQHVIFELNDEKRYLYDGLRRCYDQVVALAPYRIERIDVPWNDTTISGWLHLNPHVTKAPLVFYLTGCDVTCESWPSPLDNSFHERGMHVFSLDGIGQGQSNMRGIRLTSSNYEEAASAVLDHLVKRPEIDPDRIGLYGSGGGSLWGMRFAAVEHRLKAVASSTTYADLYYLMNEDGPRWKQLFAFLTQSESESALDEVLAEMTLHGQMEKITAPTLMVTGEYNLRDPINEVYELFDQLKVPAELWVFADQFQRYHLGIGGHDVAEMVRIDWLKDRLDGKPVRHPGEVLYLEPGNDGPHSETVVRKRRWFEPLPRG
jgi:hypothetical protein